MMAEVLVCGIDPGSRGAIAIMRADGSLVTVADMPAIEQLVGKTKRTRISPAGVATLLEGCGVTHVFMEHVQAVPGNGSLGSFVLGNASGVVEGIVAALKIPMTLVRPTKWKKAMCLTADKGTSRARAMMLWPSEACRFARVKDDGRAEACLIAQYGLNSMRAQVAA
ncbi:hypothetical protein [Acetobacter sp. DsW_063]|uniref:hypothetical protein n=1 Tax=Acetobacter sp. DsW_063 TaxID=1514894 RepID=UPI000A35FCF3|nr:hypothetical protein [Acetobacter sp. DsW_063]OUJ16502.1 hypothetical protein HK28_12580 [Acetobacter sp. DsW_063]